MKTQIFFEVSCKNKNSLYMGFIVVNGELVRQFALRNWEMEQNQCELRAFIHGFETCEKYGWLEGDIEVYTSSQNIVRCFKEAWIRKWEDKGWKNSSNKPVKFKEDWQKVSCFFYEYLPQINHSNSYKRKSHVTQLRRMAKSYLRKITKKSTIYDKGTENGAIGKNIKDH